MEEKHLKDASQIQGRILAMLCSLAEEPDAFLDTSALYSRLVNLVSDHAGYQICSLFLLDSRYRLVKVASTKEQTTRKKRPRPIACLCLGNGKMTKEVFVIDNVEAIPAAKQATTLGKGALLLVMLRTHLPQGEPGSDVMGAILLEDEKSYAFGEIDREFMAAIAPYCAAALEIARHCQKAAEMALYDDLTGLRNRRFLHDSLQRELDRANRMGRSVSLAIIDMDKLKRVNDVYGHMVGDNVLRIMAQVLAKSVRSYDVLARYGGDEFVLVMPETRPMDAEQVMRRLVAASDKARLDNLSHNTLIPSYSYGFATFPEDGKTFEQVFAAADKRLYEAKARKGITN